MPEHYLNLYIPILIDILYYFDHKIPLAESQCIHSGKMMREDFLRWAGKSGCYQAGQSRKLSLAYKISYLQNRVDAYNFF